MFSLGLASGLAAFLLALIVVSMRRSADRLLRATEELAKSEQRYRALSQDLTGIAEELALSEERFRVLVESAAELVQLYDADGRCFYASPSVERLLGCATWELVASEPLSFVHPDDVAAAERALEQMRQGMLPSGFVSYRLRRADGAYRWFEVAFTRVDDASGALRHYQSAARDVTERRELEQKLAKQAEELRELSLRDGLTGLYNRRGLLELSAQMVRVARRERHRLALLFIDLDGLKLINDELGHEQGDRAIKEIATLLFSTCRASDLVARLGGDEFVVLAANIDDAGIEVLRRRLADALAEKNSAPERPYRLGFSLGAVPFDPMRPVAIDQLIAEADARMYEDKLERRAAHRAGTVPSAR